MQRIGIWTGIAMTVIFFAFATLLVFTNVFAELVSGYQKYFLGALTYLYGFFRIVRVQRQIQNLKRNEIR